MWPVIGGAVYVLFAQFLVALDDWLAHGIVAVTGADFGHQMADLTDKFERMGAAGSLAADALMLILMAFALVAGVVLWIVLLLRKMAILVVVAFAPLLIAGWLWASDPLLVAQGDRGPRRTRLLQDASST